MTWYLASGSRECALVLLAGCTLGLWSPASVAGEPAQVDLSVSVSMTPATFVPGGHGTFTVTVHNAGPDAAGTTYPGLGNIFVYLGDFIVTNQPPPFELVAPFEGECWIERAVTEPLPDGNIALLFIYYFGAIPAGESRSCTRGIEFYSTTQAGFVSSLLLHTPNDVDTNPDNDELEYVFRLRASPIPASSPLALVTLVLGVCVAVVVMTRRRKV